MPMVTSYNHTNPDALPLFIFFFLINFPSSLIHVTQISFIKSVISFFILTQQGFCLIVIIVILIFQCVITYQSSRSDPLNRPALLSKLFSYSYSGLQNQHMENFEAPAEFLIGPLSPKQFISDLGPRNLSPTKLKNSFTLNSKSRDEP